jgi:site-specific recombinase XerD
MGRIGNRGLYYRANSPISRTVPAGHLPHDLATHLLEAGYDICIVQEPLRHKDVKTTMIITHVLNRGPNAVRNLLSD